MLDCKGEACPRPVMRTKELVEAEAPERVEVLVDNQAAGENVRRFLESRGYAAQVAGREDGLVVSGRRQAGAQPPDPAPPAEATACGPGGRRTLVLVGADRLGRGDEALGAGLMKNFLATLPEMGEGLWRLIFVNSGVKLCCQGSESLEALQGLAASGAGILVCGTCLNHFGLLEHKQVGETTNMLDVVTSLDHADKVISV
jgi:selenium metabolism protein YedF